MVCFSRREFSSRSAVLQVIIRQVQPAGPEQMLTTWPLVRIFDRGRRDLRTRCDYRDLPLLNNHNPVSSQECSAAYTSTPGYDGALDRTTIDHSLCLLSLDRKSRHVKSPFLFLTPTNQRSSRVATTRLSIHRISIRSLCPVNLGRRCTSPTKAELDTLRGTNLYGATLDRHQVWETEWEQCHTDISTVSTEWGKEFTWCVPFSVL